MPRVVSTSWANCQFRSPRSKISTKINLVRVIACNVHFMRSIERNPRLLSSPSRCSDGLPKFAAFDIALGVIYASACAIEAFGVLAAAMVRLMTD